MVHSSYASLRHLKIIFISIQWYIGEKIKSTTQSTSQSPGRPGNYHSCTSVSIRHRPKHRLQPQTHPQDQNSSHEARSTQENRGTAGPVGNCSRGKIGLRNARERSYSGRRRNTRNLNDIGFLARSCRRSLESTGLSNNQLIARCTNRVCLFEATRIFHKRA